VERVEQIAADADEVVRTVPPLTSEAEQLLLGLAGVLGVAQAAVKRASGVLDGAG
jgi:hypothetical protein